MKIKKTIKIFLVSLFIAFSGLIFYQPNKVYADTETFVVLPKLTKSSLYYNYDIFDISSSEIIPPGVLYGSEWSLAFRDSYSPQLKYEYNPNDDDDIYFENADIAYLLKPNWFDPTYYFLPKQIDSNDLYYDNKLTFFYNGDFNGFDSVERDFEYGSIVINYLLFNSAEDHHFKLFYEDVNDFQYVETFVANRLYASIEIILDMNGNYSSSKRPYAKLDYTYVSTTNTLIRKSIPTSFFDYYNDNIRYLDNKEYYLNEIQYAVSNPYDEGYRTGYDKGFEAGKKVGYDLGIVENDGYGFKTLLTTVFSGVGSFLAIQLLPGITFGMIISVPVVFGIIFFILGRRKE